MAELNLEAERSEFEAWAKTKGHDVVSRLETGGKFYVSSFTRHAWDIWQAARRAPVAAPIDAEGLPALPTERFCAWMHRERAVSAFTHPVGDRAVWDDDGYWAKKGYDREPLYTADQVRQAQRDAKSLGYALGRGAAVREYVEGRGLVGSIGDYAGFCSLLDGYGQALVECETAGYYHETIERKNAAEAAIIAYIDGRTAGTASATKPVAWARKWHVDGEKPAKERNGNGRMAWPQKFKFYAITPHKIFPDDVPLAATPSPNSPKEGAN